jgi:O-acetyl-ADP-ribose deacetylase (regulator of RNase III)
MKNIYGDLIELANLGHFDVVTHGCNCFCTMGAGIAPQMARAFGCDKFEMEDPKYRGDINKLGTIDYQSQLICPIKKTIKIAGVKVESADFGGHPIIVVNSYTQYRYGSNHADGDKKPVDYDAITMCMRKINHLFKGKTIGLPKIGAGLAGGDWNKIRGIIETELKDMNIVIVHYKTNS